jgi:alkanesulfonate monooxygenase SsuD/methylene tetrahydromethanopterin reductase-like flavin-dependent oxidoreductase (luciferase family)
MRIGVSLAQIGRQADPATIRSAAVAAEQVGYSSIWVLDRLLAPVSPRGERTDLPGPGSEPTADAANFLDPLAVLTYAAAVTQRVRLGTSVLVAPWYRPALLARSLASLDVLSDGRLTVGLGLGWSLDEYEAVGVPQRELGRRLEEALDVLAAARQPRPPVLLAATTKDGLERIARRADGWNPVGVPISLLAPMWTTVRALAAGYGRDPDSLQLVVRATVALSDRPLPADRPAYAGSFEQVAGDLDATREAGADEVILGLRGDCGLSEALEHYACLAESLELARSV